MVGWERGAQRLGWHVAVRGSACGQRAEDRLRDLAAEPSAQQGSEVRFLLLAPRDGAWSWPRVLTCTPLGLTALERPRPQAGEAPRAAEGRASPSGVGAWDRRKVSARGAELGRHCPAHEEPTGVLGAPGCTRRPTPGAPWPRLTRRLAVPAFDGHFSRERSFGVKPSRPRPRTGMPSAPSAASRPRRPLPGHPAPWSPFAAAWSASPPRGARRPPHALRFSPLSRQQCSRGRFPPLALPRSVILQTVPREVVRW